MSHKTQLLSSALLVTALTAPLTAQASWTQLNPTSAPVGRTGSAFASDGSGLLVFGGSSGGGAYYDDLWRFDGALWVNLTPTVNPPARYRHAAAYDLVRRRFVVFGGATSNLGSTRLNDTWEWDGTSWTQITPATSPSARWWHQMAFDLRNSRILMFGGQDSSGRLDETWAWDGINWTQLNPTTVPSVRERHAMTTNLLTGEIVMFGGNPGTGELGDTWVWDGANWNQVNTPTIPYITGTRNAGMTHDLVRDRVVLFGGITGGAFQANTWEFDGVDWTDRGLSPLTPRTFPAMAFVEGLGKTYLFTGYGGTGVYFPGTWEYQTNAVADYQSAGTGCAGSAGTPTLSPGSLPWMGSTIDVYITGLAANASAFMLIGWSSTNWAGGSLPYPLTLVGSPTCDLMVSPDLAVNVATSGGTGTWSLPLPVQASLAGAAFFNQCLALEPVGGQMRIISSNRGDARIGAR